MNKMLCYILGILFIIYIIIFSTFNVITAKEKSNKTVEKKIERSKTKKSINKEDNKIRPGIFLPIPKPKPEDWLANHDEPGQTLDEFINDEHNTPDNKRNKIYLLPVEDFSKFNNVPSLITLKEFTEKYFSMTVVIMPHTKFSIENIRERRNSFSGDKQYHAGDILEEMKNIIPHDAFCVLAIALTDLYPEEDWNFVFGLASFMERVGVFSFARYYPSFYLGNKEAQKKDEINNQFTLRCCKIISHETGHMFGMMHCTSYLCNMNGSNNLAEFDNQPLYLCPVCLSKLQKSTNFDVCERYDSLLEFYKGCRFKEDCKWLMARQQIIKSSNL